MPTIEAIEPTTSTDTLAARLAFALDVREELIVGTFGEQRAERAARSRNRALFEIFDDYLRAAFGRSPSKPAEIVEAALRSDARLEREAPELRASYSTIANNFATVGNLIVTETYGDVGRLVPAIADRTDLQNFLPYTAYRLEQGGGLTKVPTNGRLPAADVMSADGGPLTLDTRGAVLTVSRQTLVNDDIGAIRKVFADSARRAAIAEERALVEEIAEESDSFYTAGRGNLLSSKALSSTNLPLAEAALWAQKDARAVPVFARPRILLVPPTLRYAAAALFEGFAPEDRLQVETSPYLEDATIGGSSSSTWYVLADPRVLPAFTVGYLRGSLRRPIVDTDPNPIDTLGIKLRVYHDFGVAGVNPQAALKATA
ncbi:MAG: hypothetical protein ACF8XB_00590 [Planctomycetota bacterium JB042]